MNAPYMPLRASDLLTQAYERVRPTLIRQRPLKAPVQLLWAATENARTFAADDVVAAAFFQLARDTGLIADLDHSVRHLAGEDTVRHVRLIAAGELESYRDGRSRKITVASIFAYIARKLAAEGATQATRLGVGAAQSGTQEPERGRGRRHTDPIEKSKS